MTTQEAKEKLEQLIAQIKKDYDVEIVMKEPNKSYSDVEYIHIDSPDIWGGLSFPYKEGDGYDEILHHLAYEGFQKLFKLERSIYKKKSDGTNKG